MWVLFAIGFVCFLVDGYFWYLVCGLWVGGYFWYLVCVLVSWGLGLVLGLCVCGLVSM